ncbi:MAG: membrane protein insertase YidC [Alphaproteobacteria bacterium]|nr:membrane protein insertase YidC [Alphaproteobacteria bacterium]
MVQYLDKNSGFAQWNANKNNAQKKSGLGGFMWWFLIFVAAWWTVGLFMTPPPSNTVAPDNTPVVDLSSVPTAEISSNDITATVQGLRISNVKLSKFTVSATDTTPVSLLSADGAFAEFGLIANGTTAPTATTVWKTTDGKFTWRNPDGITFTRTISVDGYDIVVSDEIHNTTKRDIAFAPYARIVRANDMTSSAGVSTGAVALANSDIERADWRKLDKRSYAYQTTRGFVGFTDQYWGTIVNIDSPDQTMTIKKAGQLYGADVAASAIAVPAGTTAKITYNLFSGPLEQDVLNAANSHIDGIDDIIDYGWFGFLARPMLWFLNVLNSLVMNYGLAIILMTLFLRLLMWPLTRKSYTSMIAMQKMQPELQRIQKLYANDKARLQMEMLKVYQTHKTSPMSGCLPMLIQIPIFFALYKALLISVQMRSAGFLWISDLAVMDPYFILPILMGATMWLQQYLQSASRGKTADKNDITAQTQKMMRWMPILFTIMFAWMPAGLVLYWTVSNIFGIIQMYIIKHQSK